jgi:superoxide dismutase, Fe-Mn family
MDISYDISKLKPVIEETHFAEHLKIYNNNKSRYDQGVGDIPFEKAGVHLHELYFQNIREFRLDNKPLGKIQDILETRYGNWANFYKSYIDTVGKLQGSGWVFMNTAGYLNIIPNNRIVDNIAFVIDFWEHAYYPKYGADKESYARDTLNIINWEVVNRRILEAKDKKQSKWSITD